MDSQRFDAIARQMEGSSSRRGVIRAALAATVGLLAPVLMLHPDEVAARRNMCAVRCGGEHRLCRAQARYRGPSVKEWKRICTLQRNFCLRRCGFDQVKAPIRGVVRG